MKLLHLDSSFMGEYSASRGLTALAVEKIKATHPGIAVTYHDLARDEFPHATLATIPFDPDAPVDPDAAHPEQRRSEATLEQFLETDILVIGAPMYNYTIPSQLKVWIDRIVISRKTFRYGENGTLIGLATGKRAVIIVTSGGVYSPGTPAAHLDFSVSYLRAMFAVIGITADFIVAEGLALGPESRANALTKAQAAIADLQI